MIPDWLVSTLRPHPFRGKLRLLDSFTPRHGNRSASVFKLDMELDLSDSIQRNVYLGTYEPHETAIVRNRLKPGMTFVDAGANVGYFTALAASCVGPSGRVFSFEPQPDSYRKIAAMIERNNLPQVRAFRCGLSSAEGILPLYLAPEGDGEQNATMVEHGASRCVMVPVKTLDQWARDMQIEQIDLIKIDVEGHEPKVLEGAARLLTERRIKAVLTEFNEVWLRKSGNSSDRLHTSLERAGFRDAAGPAHFHATSMETRFFHLEA